MKIPAVPIQTDYVKFVGGIDQKTPVLSLKPGNALDAQNYEPDVFGGYRRMGGYESYTGKPAPSDATYTFVRAVFVGTPVVGDTVTGSTFGATGVVAYCDLGLVNYPYEWVALTKVVGTFVNGEAFTGGGGGTISETPALRAAPSALDDARALNAAADIYRTDIGLPMLGSGGALGVWLYKGAVYGFRNNALGTAAVMWRAYPQRRSIAFTSGGTYVIAVGNTITGATSAATAVVTKVTVTSGSWAAGTAAGTLYFDTQTGTFQAENLDVDVNLNVATIAGNSTDIAGWNQVDLGTLLSFTSGGTYQILAGDTVTGAASAATAIVTQVILTGGSWGAGTASGLLYLKGQTSTFQNENLDVGANPNVATTTAASARPITLDPGGRYDFVNYNFTGSADTLKMFACNGVGRAFQYDGDSIVPIHTGMAEDTPKFIAAYKKMLFLGFRGSLQNSGVGAPLTWSVVTGAAEIAAGDEITGLLAGTQSLFIFLRNSTYYLTGSSVADFVLNPLALDMGAIPYTSQLVGQPIALDDRGIVPFVPGQDYGNFNFDTTSRQVQDLVDEIRGSVVASVAIRSRNQYWLFAPGTDEAGQPYTRGLIMTVDGRKIVGITRFRIPLYVTCASAGEGTSGEERVFFGASNGVVYEMNKGSSFDGDEIEAYIRMPFNNLRMPRHEKRFRKLQLEMTCDSYTAIRFHPEFDYGNADKAQHRVTTEVVVGAGGYWDVNLWEQFFWDAQVVASPEFSIEGTGINMGMIFYSKSDIDLGHTLQGALIHYTPRKVRR